MAEFTAEPGSAGAGISARASNVVNVAAAVTSVALIVGVGIWGYRLLVRDVTGVPVVRAMGGEMRVAPADPGGEISANLGLAVNAVPGEGGAAEPEDRLVLAPNRVDLQAEDLDVVPTVEAGEPLSTEEDAPVDRLALATAQPSEPLTAAQVLELADQIAAGVEPFDEDEDLGSSAPVVTAVNGVAVNPDVIPDTVPGLRRSLRPTVRPAALSVAPAAAPQQAEPAAASAVVNAETIPAGTHLIQLGAFDSAEIAHSEWGRMQGLFPDFFADKDQVVQAVTNGGRTFYRLRAMGFSDLNDARRFCSALTAQGTDCIPVVVR